MSVNLELSRYAWAAQILRQLLAKGEGSRLVFDIGAGDGSMRAAVEAVGGIYHGFDLHPSCSEIATWDLANPFAGRAQIASGAILLDVIEHCSNPGLALRHIAQAIEPGGFLVLTTPNPRWSRSRFFALKSGYPICFTKSDLDLNHHVFPPWPHIVDWMLADAGFSVECYVTLDGSTPWPGRPFNLRYPLRWALAATLKSLEWIDPSARGMSYGLVGRKLD